MRKCAACGYLSLSDNECCAHCGAALAAPAPAHDLVAVGAPPPRPATTPVAPPPVAPAPPAWSGTAAAPSEWAGRGWIGREWTGASEPARPVAPTRTRLRLVPLLILVALVAAALGASRLLQHDALPAGTSDFVAGRGVQYAAPDYTYTA